MSKPSILDEVSMKLFGKQLNDLTEDEMYHLGLWIIPVYVGHSVIGYYYIDQNPNMEGEKVCIN